MRSDREQEPEVGFQMTHEPKCSNGRMDPQTERERVGESTVNVTW